VEQGPNNIKERKQLRTDLPTSGKNGRDALVHVPRGSAARQVLGACVDYLIEGANAIIGKIAKALSAAETANTGITAP
jgi:hypothetical protein